MTAEFDQIKARVLKALEGLNPHLTYHSVGHTLDVVNESERIAREEGITSERQLLLLKIAALYHDTGFLQTYTGHEEKSCELFTRDAPHFGLKDEEEQTIRSLILATKVPQKPSTLLEKIICDADLDYLGRSDFSTIGDRLRREFLHYSIVKDDQDWERRQLAFLKNHHYHTASSQRLREPVKQNNYNQLL